MDFISKVWHGQMGLPRTYWLLGVIGCFLWGLPIGMVKPGSITAIAVVGLFLAYIVIVNVGTWRAATLYEGPKFWAVLAKIAVAALPVLLVVGTLAAIVLPAISQPSLDKDGKPCTEVTEFLGECKRH